MDLSSHILADFFACDKDKISWWGIVYSIATYCSCTYFGYRTIPTWDVFASVSTCVTYCTSCTMIFDLKISHYTYDCIKTMGGKITLMYDITKIRSFHFLSVCFFGSILFFFHNYFAEPSPRLNCIFHHFQWIVLYL